MPSLDESGLAPERTGLAWERCGFAFAGLAGVVLSVAAHRDAPGLAPLALVLLAVGVAVWRVGRRDYARGATAQPRVLRLISAATVGGGVAAVVVVLLPL